jgi:pimeloyl-ACP methyl ester carboxylesterase
VSAADFAILRLIFAVDPASPLPREEADKLIEACGRPGAMQAALNYYRAAGPMHNLWNDVGVCRVPLQVQWGAKDRYLEEKIAIPNTDEKEFAPLAVPSSLVRHPNATHWVQWDEPEAVSDALIEFLNDE